MAKDIYTVTVDRINESANKDPQFTMSASGIEVRPDGGLSIESEKGGRGMGASTWGRIVIDRRPIKPGAE